MCCGSCPQWAVGAARAVRVARVVMAMMVDAPVNVVESALAMGTAWW